MRKNSSIYTSFIMQPTPNNEDEELLFQKVSVERLSLPTSVFRSLENEAVHANSVWFFCGQNSKTSGLCGRKEHTDSITTTGTWHYQASGEKVNLC